jgi:predicted DNA-binding WGR domain protein
MTNSIDRNQAIRTEKLINVNGLANNNKYWICSLMPNGNLEVEYGRIGAKNARTHTYQTTSQREGETKLESLIKEKLKKGYIHAYVEEENKSELDWKALEEKNPEVKEHIERLNLIGEQIRSHSQISFNKAKGVFESNLGVISEKTIEKARLVLAGVERNLNKRGFSEAAEEYLRIIQIPIGAKLNLEEVLGNRRKIRQQELVLDFLTEGTKRIGVLREIILKATELDSNKRSAWIKWGDTETTEKDCPELEGKRSQFICWS